MLTRDAAASAVQAAGVDAPVHFHDVIGSTNSEAIRLAGLDAPAWTVVAAGHQRAGRGRLGRTWVEMPRTSLLVSVVLRPGLAPTHAALVALAAGASLVEACRSAAGVAAACKWPNDVVVGERKLAGVLAEAKVSGGRLEHVVVGVGLNMGQRAEDFPPEIHPSATSVAIEGGRPDPAGILTAYLVQLRRFLAPERDDGGAAILDAYRGVCATIGRTVRATTTDGGEVLGRATGIGEGGELLVETGTGLDRVAFGEVEHLR